MGRKPRLVNRKNLSWVISIPLFIFVLAACDGDGGGGGGGGGNGATGNELNVEILDASISSPATVTFRLTDADGNPLGRSGVSMNFVIARIEPGQDEYIDYITRVQTSPTTNVTAVQASSESAANNPDNLEDLGDGMFKYTFSTPIPDNYNSSATHTVGIYATRTIGSQTFVSNDTFDFVPAGGNVDTVRDIVRNEACNTCHDPLEAHGGSRRDVKLCVLCHTSKIVDPNTGELVDHIDPGSGNNLGFKIMVHKIHRGKELPSVEEGMPYFFEAFQDNILDFSTVGFPQDIRNCTKCHTEEAAQGDEYINDPSRAACGSCHDDVNFETAENHPVIQLTDNNCSGCHLPSTGDEFDLSVTGAHTVPLRSAELPGVNFEILSVKSVETDSSIVVPGEHPAVTFRITNDAGTAINPSDMTSLNLTLAGPTTDYSIQDYNGDGDTTGTPNGAEYFTQENARMTSVPDGSGNFTYSFNTAIPDNATGTYTVGIEGYKEVTVGGDNKVLLETVRDAGMNEIFFFPVTDSPAVQRRMVVANDMCSDCHGTFSVDFSIHGGSRNNVEYCVLCHNPSADDIRRRPESDPMTASIDFKAMIHKIHTGEDLTAENYIIYGFGNVPHDFAEVRYPGDRRDCEACHLPDTYILDPGNGVLSEGVLPSTERTFTLSGMDKVVTDIFTTTPVVSVCTSCHDNLEVNASGDGITAVNHLGGAQLESACIDCHIAGEPLGVEEVHIPPLPPDERIGRPQIVD